MRPISRAAAVRLTEGPVTLLAARARALLPEGVRDGDNVGLKDGDGYASKRAYNAVSRAGHDSLPGRGKGQQWC